MKKKLHMSSRGKGGLHLKKSKRRNGTTSIGSGTSARSLAQRGNTIVLGSKNRGSTARLDSM